MKSIKTIRDENILRQFKDKKTRENGFYLLVKKYKEFLYWHIRKIVIKHEDTDDVLQNTFIKIWQNLDSFKQRSKLSTWLYRIATNEALTYLKSKLYKTYASKGSGEVSDLLLANLKSDPYIEGDSTQLALQEAVIKLPEKQRLVFNMKYFDNMTYAQMAEILDTSIGALKTSYHYAVKKIKKSLDLQQT